MNILNDLKLQYKYGGIVQKLIYLNIAIFLISIVFFYSFQFRQFQYPSWLALDGNFSEFVLIPWTLVTYMFFHDGFMHLLFNMLVLHFSARLFSTYFSDKQLLGIYILGGFFAGIVYVLFSYIINSSLSIVGASAAIWAILIAVTVYAPLMQLRIPLLGTFKLWQVVAVIVVFDILQIPFGNLGGHVTHIAGGFFGFIYIKILQKGTDLSLIITKIIDFFTKLTVPKEKTPFKKVHKNKSTSFTNQPKDINQQKIDDILDKISKSGYESLSKEEKLFLFKIGKE